MIQPIAYIFLIAAPVLYGLNGVLLKRGSQGVPPFTAMTISMAVLLTLSGICSRVFEPDFSWSFKDNPKALLSLLLVGFVNTAAFWCFLNAYKYVSVWQYQVFSHLTPMFAGVFAFLLLGEPLTWKLFAGTALIFVGLYVALH